MVVRCAGAALYIRAKTGFLEEPVTGADPSHAPDLSRVFYPSRVGYPAEVCVNGSSSWSPVMAAHLMHTLMQVAQLGKDRGESIIRTRKQNNVIKIFNIIEIRKINRNIYKNQLPSLMIGNVRSSQICQNSNYRVKNEGPVHPSLATR